MEANPISPFADCVCSEFGIIHKQLKLHELLHQVQLGQKDNLIKVQKGKHLLKKKKK